MRIAASVKVALVGAFLTLLLSLLFTTGMTSAHSMNTLQSQAPCRTYTTVTQRFRGYADPNTRQFIPSPVFFQGQRGVYIHVGNRRVFHRVMFTTFERVTIITICNGHRSQRVVIREM